MKNRAIIVSDMDMEELGQFIDVLKQSGFKDQRQVEVLDQILQSADNVAPACVPRDVIGMESRFRILDVNSGKSEQYTLVLPEKADISQGRISILAPLGTAVLGHRAGDLIEADVPAGKRIPFHQCPPMIKNIPAGPQTAADPTTGIRENRVDTSADNTAEGSPHTQKAKPARTP